MLYGLASTLLIFVSIACIAIVFSPKMLNDNTNKRARSLFLKKKKKEKLASIDLQTDRRIVNEFNEDANSRSVRMLRRGQKLLNANDALQNSTIRMSLAQAGYRGSKSAATYILFRLLAPPLLAIVTALYIYFVFPHIVETPLRYILFIALAAAIGFFLPVILLKNKKNKRQTAIKAGYPDMIDLVMICTESGMSVELAFRRVAEELGAESAELKDEIEILTAELSYLSERRIAYENFAKRTSIPQVRALTSMIIQAELYGTPVSQTLRVLSEESRDERMSEAERKAASLPSKLTVPMMLFFMPTLFIVIMTPAVLQIMDNF